MEDRDGDGRYEVARVFAEGLTPSMGLVWRAGKLYAADPPDLVTLEDSDGDGRADKRTVLLTGFGHTDNGSLHGLTFGPDGLLYFTLGNPDGYDLHGPDGSHARGGTGALIRCRADGGRVETVARGFDNLIEIVFTPEGSIVGTVNWYQLPERGARDALVHILEQSQFPLHPQDSRAPHLQFNAVLPPLALFPAVAHSGLEVYRGTAFPGFMRGNLFAAEHNTRKIVRHQLTPKGASYGVESFDFVSTPDPDVHFSDVLADADGSLLAIDTGSWYVTHCPTGRIRQAPAQGGIYRISFRGNHPQIPAPIKVPELRAALNGTNLEVMAAAVRAAGRETNFAPEIAALLRSPHLGLRLAAAEVLAHSGNRVDVTNLVAALAADTDAFLEHALIFALSRLADKQALLSALDHPNAKVQRAALLLLDQPPFQAAPAAAVRDRLNIGDPRLQDTARWVLLRHPEWGETGANFLEKIIETSDQTEADRQALNQFLPLFQSNSIVIGTLSRSLAVTNQSVTDSQRVRLLEALAALDLREIPASLTDAVLQILRRGSSSVLSPAIRASGALRVVGAEEPLIVIARDTARSANLRNDALRELVRRRRPLEEAEMDFLLGQLATTNASLARLAAAETLSSAPLAPKQLVAFLEAVRGDAIIAPASILRAVEDRIHPDSAEPLLDYLAASLERGWLVSADQLTKVQAAVPEAQRGRAASLLARLAENTASQRRRLAEFEPLLKGGDYTRGQKVFFEKAQCTTCHQVWGNGGRVGPDLTGVGSVRSGRDLLESIVLPSATIAQGYDTLTVSTRDGASHTGVRVGKNEDPLLLRNASGAEIVIHRQQIDQIRQDKLSLMPDNLVNLLTRDELRDLLAYLQSK